MSDGQSRPEKQIYQLDQLLRDFYSREMQAGLPAMLQGLTGEEAALGEAADAAGLPAADQWELVEGAAGMQPDRNGSVAARASATVNGAPSVGTARLIQADHGRSRVNAGTRAAMMVVTAAACCLLVVGMQLASRDVSPGSQAPTAWDRPGTAAGVAGSDAAHPSAAASERGRPQPVERSGRTRTDARTDGVPVMLGQPEMRPAGGGLEIEVPEESIEVFPIDDPRPLRKPKTNPSDPTDFPSASQTGKRQPVVAPSGR